MRPVFSILAAATLLAATTAFVTTRVVQARAQGQENPPGPDPAAMAKMMELATPGPEHKELSKMAGTWSTHYKARFGPELPWQEFEGTSENKVVLGGRYVMQDVNFSMQGMALQGLQILGFDKLSGEYTAQWADSMSTWWVGCHGKRDEKGQIDMSGTMKDAAGERAYRMVVRHVSDDESQVEMYDTIPPKGEVLVMTMTSKRKK